MTNERSSELALFQIIHMNKSIVGTREQPRLVPTNIRGGQILPIDVFSVLCKSNLIRWIKVILKRHIRSAFLMLTAKLLKRIELVDFDTPVNMGCSHQWWTNRVCLVIIWPELKLRKFQTCHRLCIIIQWGTIIAEILIVGNTWLFATVESHLGALHFSVQICLVFFFLHFFLNFNCK